MMWMAGGAALGLLAGGVIWLLEPSPSKWASIRSAGGDFRATEPTAAASAHEVFVGRFMTLLSITLFCLPFVGLVLGIGAVWATWKTRGWLRFVSWTGAVLAAIVTILCIIPLAKHP
jgi:hypothetical protein